MTSESMPSAAPQIALIFDVDGTIADSFEIFVESFEAVVRQKEPLTPAQINEFRGMSVKDVAKQLHIRPWQIPRLIARGRPEVSSRMHRVQAFTGMPEVIRELAHTFPLYILSTNSVQTIEDFLNRYNLRDCISGIQGEIGVFGKAKHLKKLRKSLGLSAEACVYVGDEIRDVEAARRAGMRCVSVTWGFSTEAALRAHHPTALAHTPAELERILQELAA